MSIEQNFHHAEQDSLNQKYDSGMERKILRFWREYEPKKVQSLLDQGQLRQTLQLKAVALFDMQHSLEKYDRLDPVLAAMEAWNRLMRIEEDAEEEAAAWGMTLEEYKNRDWIMD